MKININIGDAIHIQSFKNTHKELPVKLQGKDNKAVCTIQYPFEQGKTIKFTFNSINDIVNAVRDCLNEMYKIIEPEPSSPFLINNLFNTEYGFVCHPMNDLFIEDIEYDTKTCELGVSIGS